MMQEIYGFAQEPQFQESLAQQGIAAQKDANATQNKYDAWGAVLDSPVGQKATNWVVDKIFG
jgi:hypothetical protein